MALQLRNLASGMPTQGTRDNPLEGKSVVIVDDSRVQRRRLKELFESLGLRCVGEADNGLDGLQLCESLKPNLVSLDILMPVMHGVEAVGYIREAEAARYIVLVSALTDLEEVAKLRPNGHTPDAIFSKKDSRETFREVITNIFMADIIGDAYGQGASDSGNEGVVSAHSPDDPSESSGSRRGVASDEAI
jgi:two-component system chemotaxis response regulator CheY